MLSRLVVGKSSADEMRVYLSKCNNAVLQLPSCGRDLMLAICSASSQSGLKTRTCTASVPLFSSMRVLGDLACPLERR